MVDGMTERPTIDELRMKNAMDEALRGTCTRAQVGAILTRNTRIISSGYVGSPPGQPHCTDAGCLIDPNTGGCIRTLHAEVNAILFAARKGISTEWATLYTTLSPCLACAKVIVTAGIVRVVYLTAYRDRTGIEYLNSAGIHVDEYRT